MPVFPFEDITDCDLDGGDYSDFCAFAADIQLQNMGSPAPPLRLINVDREDEQNDQPEENEEEPDDDREEDNDEHHGASNSLFSNMYHNSHALLSAPSILMPLFRYSTDNDVDNDELAQGDLTSSLQASTSSQRQNNGDGSSTSQSGDQASSSQDATASRDNIRNSGVHDIPDGVDPSFLDALPLEMRREV